MRVYWGVGAAIRRQSNIRQFMAGDRQHILPRFLLKGFASRIHGKETYTWVYLRKGAIFEANINKIGIEKHFYGRKGELNVDAKITDFEGEYAPLLDELRAHKGQVDISDPMIANFITHLVVRTKHIRDSYRESSEFLIEKIFEYLSDFDNLKKAILNRPDLIRKNLESELKDFPLPNPYKEKFKKRLIDMYPSILDTQKAEMQQLCKSYLEMAKRVAPRAIREGHIKGLSQGLTPEARVEDYKGLRYFVYNSEESLILGDVGCMFETMGKRRFKSITFEDDKIINLFLPISDRQILIGSSHSGNPQISSKNLNKEIAKCSREFFICSKRSQDIASLVSLLGSETGIISKEEVEQMAEEIISTTAT